MIRLGHIKGLSAYRPRRLGDFTFGPSAGVSLPSFQPSRAFDQNPPAPQIAPQVALNTPAAFYKTRAEVDQIMRTASDQPYVSGRGGADTGSPGDAGTEVMTHILTWEDDPGAAPTPQDRPYRDNTPVDENGNPLVGPSASDRSPDRVDSLSPGIANTGSWVKTWGPPLAVVAAVGIGFWMLRR